MVKDKEPDEIGDEEESEEWIILLAKIKAVMDGANNAYKKGDINLDSSCERLC